MADPINLNKARKARARTEAKHQAAENRIRFGRAKAEKAAAAMAETRAMRALEQKKREP